MSGKQIDYLVSRFPVTSETFIVRELDALAHTDGLTVGLRSLFSSPDPQVHDIARPWMAKLVCPGIGASVTGLAWALFRHPLVTLSILADVVRGYAARPSLLLRALVTVPIAMAHARDLRSSGSARHIHAHYATYPALAAWICSRLAGATYSVTIHAHDLYVDQSMLGRKLDGAEFIVTVSEYNRRILARYTSTPIQVIHCGINTAAYPFRPRRIPDHGPIRALCVASLQEYKGHEVLLRALALGGPGVDRIELDLIGGGPLADELQALATELGLASRVRFHGGQSETAVKQALAEADIFVLPSIIAADGQMEGLPVALMEALASGIPTASTSLSGIPELVVPGKTGLLATPADAQSLQATLEQLISSGATLDGYARTGRDLVEQEFDSAATTAALLALFTTN
ncbi:colanic acid biosynthesis glycosyltransferase WcaL [Mycobacterium sp. CBMA293]|uniref:glycosyltransferase n=2 Tax=Mycolicibacterium TaxID=1866885 RepID=UPI0012DCB40A|nr:MULTISPECIES: glycosyltransferase [unclassified Mycolicibacterium]MUL49493.1 colanic acid biosynthesis glycosyltransferase WcaL [Mycolicibacterium sp. CBMA 360]MUL62077.1 colanic acid biosynthesis glycosyltransferase WcaL [Mycolicibacterium sp. CBMA 335]MUL73352.1 colanic acid biosynthesis glycosyltransferase WcaL [Mycolicibacterium sp. CBMA 311]MUL96521.1 colanic acid biosynthesis glycosyltransferase WcaL [Mycolicibacterium sp. CBMA 230]MUM05420.1 colanic acid biosynthesis glycosyltransfer